jgi:glycine/D-amino acid oxidase-like deaminating enzyme
MRVAIIGAGFSGMLAAYQLEKKGIDVTVYEKEEYIGGHFRTLINSDFCIELGTVFSFSSTIKTLLLELNIDFSERFSYRNFVDEQYNNKELLSRFEVAALIEELSRLEKILQNYASSINTLNYGTIHEDLLVPLYDFLNFYDLPLISQLVAPHFSSFGFGTIRETQAFYAFSIFNLTTLLSFLRGDKLLFIDKGVS